jgi:large conductance mechanosensitive channel
MKGFRKFLMQGNVIDLAVAVVIGVAFNAIVQALVKYIITPLITAEISHRVNFTTLHFYVGSTKITYGAVINAAVSFFVIALVIYYLVVAPNARLTALAARNKAATDRQCPECLSTIPLNAKRCMYCTSEVPPVPIPDVPVQRRRRHGMRPTGGRPAPAAADGAEPSVPSD